MKATQILMEEHRAIERALAVLDAAAARMEAGEGVPTTLLLRTLEFIRLFADRCHHGKEEGFLFPALQRSGLPMDGGPLAVMNAEHDDGRALVRVMGEALDGIATGDDGARPEFCRAARDFSALLRAHIQKEDHILFVMAGMRIPPAEQERLAGEFANAEASGEACRSKGELLRTLGELEREIAEDVPASRA